MRYGNGAMMVSERIINEITNALTIASDSQDHYAAQ
jgi:hypothetical protein